MLRKWRTKPHLAKLASSGLISSQKPTICRIAVHFTISTYGNQRLPSERIRWPSKAIPFTSSQTSLRIRRKPRTPSDTNHFKGFNFTDPKPDPVWLEDLGRADTVSPIPNTLGKSQDIRFSCWCKDSSENPKKFLARGISSTIFLPVCIQNIWEKLYRCFIDKHSPSCQTFPKQHLWYLSWRFKKVC